MKKSLALTASLFFSAPLSVLADGEFSVSCPSAEEVNKNTCKEDKDKKSQCTRDIPSQHGGAWIGDFNTENSDVLKLQTVWQDIFFNPVCLYIIKNDNKSVTLKNKTLNGLGCIPNKKENGFVCEGVDLNRK